MKKQSKRFLEVSLINSTYLNPDEDFSEDFLLWQSSIMEEINSEPENEFIWDADVINSITDDEFFNMIRSNYDDYDFWD
jgi:hypothetical protein